MVKLLIYWYSNQLVNIRWKDTTTTTFRMTNGTRQGSLLSPYLFALYIRGVSGKILNSGAGCHMGGVPCNILLYADDMVVLAPTWQSMQIITCE